MRIVIDASVAVNWFLLDETQQAAYASGVRQKIRDAEMVCVPGHWMLEILNALLVAERRKRILAPAVNHAVGLLRQLPIRSDTQGDQANAEILEIARQNMLSIYDAAYLELALRIGASLASLDEPLKAAAKKRGVRLI